MSQTRSQVQAKISKKFESYVRAHVDQYPDPDAFFESLQQWPIKAVRANTHVTSIEDLASQWDIGCDYVPWCSDAIYFDWDAKIGTTSQHDQGLCYIGDPSAMLPIECIEFSLDATVVDMCAAPGGKSTHVLNKLSSDGQLIANDVNPSRARTLKENIERLTGAIASGKSPRVSVESQEISDLVERYQGVADLVVLDAPCSGEAMMRRSNTARRQWSEKLIRKMAELQSTLLSSAVELAKPGGRIVYSTCTFNESENVEPLLSLGDSVQVSSGDAIADFLGAHARGIAKEYSYVLYPHLVRGDGQSVSVLTKN